MHRRSDLLYIRVRYLGARQAPPREQREHNTTRDRPWSPKPAGLPASANGPSNEGEANPGDSREDRDHHKCGDVLNQVGVIGRNKIWFIRLKSAHELNY